MNTLGFPLVSLLIFLPFFGGILIFTLGRSQDNPEDDRLSRQLTVIVAALVFALSLYALISIDPANPNAQFVERARWLPVLGSDYSVGLDYVSALLVALTGFLTLLGVIASWREMSGRSAGFGALLLFLEGGVIGSFASLDLLIFFVFFELMLVPSYFLVGVFGGERRGYAAIKFFIYTTFGSLLMLVGILSLHYAFLAATGQSTFNINELTSKPLPADIQIPIFLAFALAFAIKVPLFPFHTWIGDLYTQAPTTTLLLLTMMVKVGAYGFLRLCLPLFPDASIYFGPILSALAAFGILYGGFIAARQRDIVRLMAYSSVAHLGFVILGIFALNTQGLSGAVLQMINHGLSAGSIFFIASIIISRLGTSDLDRLGGLARRWPVLSGFFLVSLFSAAGLPGLNGFVGEFLILLGAFRRQPGFAVIGALGVVLSAIYLLRMYRMAMHGEEGAAIRDQQGKTGPDLYPREALVLIPIALLIVWIGVNPTGILRGIDPVSNLRLSNILQASTAIGEAPITVSEANR